MQLGWFHRDAAVANILLARVSTRPYIVMRTETEILDWHREQPIGAEADDTKGEEEMIELTS